MTSQFRWSAVLIAALLSPSQVSSQNSPISDLTRYVALWEGLATVIGDAGDARCATGAQSARVWAHDHMRELVEIEGRIVAAESDPVQQDSLLADSLQRRFTSALEAYLDWGMACIENPEAVSAGEYVDSLRAELEGQIAEAPSRLEQDLAALDSPETIARQILADGEDLALSGNVDLALEAYRQAQLIDSTLIVEADSWNVLCWFGSLWGQPEDVLPACERAVALAPGEGWIADSRGLARALTGDTDGAIEDFSAFVRWTNDREDRRQRQRWIDELRAGRNPFTKELLDQLLRQP